MGLEYEFVNYAGHFPRSYIALFVGNWCAWSADNLE